jgi:hypothetical protein
VATVGAPAPARLRRGQDNTCAVKLECDVGKVLEALAGDGGERREELCCGGAQGMRRRLMARGGRLSGAGAREGRPWVALWSASLRGEGFTVAKRVQPCRGAQCLTA